MPKKSLVDRRAFLKSAAVGATALAAEPLRAVGQPSEPLPQAAAPQMSQQVEAAQQAHVELMTTERPAADFMVDVLKSLGFEYLCANCGATFRALHESIINYGGNHSPEFVSCMHEEAAVAMAHGYSKIEGKPLLVMVHGTVGLQHAAMAIYNAYCDRVPVFIVTGNRADAETRRIGTVEWYHSVQDGGLLVRDFIKWDDSPGSCGHFAESAVRAYKIAMTPPFGPVLLVADSELQETPIDGLHFEIPKLTLPAPPQGDSGAISEAAQLLVMAENPVIVTDRLARTAQGMMRLIELAEALQAPVIDLRGRMNFPTRHALNQTDRRRSVIAGADVILGLEVADFFGVLNSMADRLERKSRSVIQPGTKLIQITVGDLFLKSNYQDFQRFQEVDVDIAADAEASLPSLIEAVKRLSNADRQRVFQERGARLAQAQQRSLERSRSDAAFGWDASPITTARLAYELWEQIKGEDWSLVSDDHYISSWPRRLWTFDKYYQYIGGSGAAGIGYGAPAALGAALANRKHGRLSVNIQSDGDLMFSPGILWTAAHHKIPMLSVMHNNRAYHQEVMHIQQMANRHNRGITRVGIGTKIDNPNIDFATLAKSMGVYGEGPISNPRELAPALRRAIAVVKGGEPALLDVVSEPR